jgi:hypothetical protein
MRDIDVSLCIECPRILQHIPCSSLVSPKMMVVREKAKDSSRARCFEVSDWQRVECICSSLDNDKDDERVDMSARRALILAPSCVPCRACTSNSHVLLSPRRGEGPCRRYSSTRKIWSSESANTKKTASSSKIHTDLPVPKSIAAYLDEYVIGQDHAKRALAVGVFNHYLKAASNASSSTNVLEKEYTQPILYADRVKVKKLAARSKDKEDEEEILTDYVGQTKGSKRWNDQVDSSEKGSEMKISGE